MKPFLLIFSLLTITFHSSGYKQEIMTEPLSGINSILIKLQSANEDTTKIKLYNDLFYLYTIAKTEDALKYLAPALDLSKKLNYEYVLTTLSIGRVYWKLGKFELALKYHFEALKEYRKQNSQSQGSAYIYQFIGQDYGDWGKYPEALKYFSLCKEIYEAKKDTSNLASVYLYISWVHSKQGNFPEASRNNFEAMKLSELLHDDYSVAVALVNVAIDLTYLDKEEEALTYFYKANLNYKKMNDITNLSGNYIYIADAYINLKKYSEALNSTAMAFYYGNKIDDKIAMAEALSKRADIYFQQEKINQAANAYEAAIRYLNTANARHLLAEKYGKLGTCYVRLNKPILAKQALDSADAAGSNLASQMLQSSYYNGKQLYDSLTGNWESAYRNFYHYISLRDSIYNESNSKKLLNYKVQYDYDKKEATVKAEQEKKDIRQRLVRNSIIGALAGTLVFLVVVYRQRNKISLARKRSDELLLNILPQETADELKATGAAQAKHFDEVTVMFTDFKNFTQASEILSPVELVQEIHECYSAFDKIISELNLEKIKTIGDSYMCAGGLPVPNKSNAVDTVRAAMKINEFMLALKLKRISENKPYFEIRIGCHTGPVVAGIVGIKKFAYDIWGDTVNIASRMESAGEAGRVNVSGTTYELIKDIFSCNYRGKISAKNKGEIDMYFVESAGQSDS